MLKIQTVSRIHTSTQLGLSKKSFRCSATVVEFEITFCWRDLREIGRGNLWFKWSVMGASILYSWLSSCMWLGSIDGWKLKSSLEYLITILRALRRLNHEDIIHHQNHNDRLLQVTQMMMAILYCNYLNKADLGCAL
jgi:hypothetical protein